LKEKNSLYIDLPESISPDILRSSSIEENINLQERMRQNSTSVRNMLREKFQLGLKNMTQDEQEKLVNESSILAFNQNFL
jgi:hypothetical protein